MATHALLEETTAGEIQGNSHFIRAVTEMADHSSVVTGQAIYTDKGLKLVDKGVRIDSRLYDRLVQHRLRDPIDAELIVENLVDANVLAEHARAKCESTVLMRRLAQASGGVDRLLQPLRAVQLTRQIAFKLTVMHQQRPELYFHGLQMTLVAIYLGQQSGWNEQDCTSAAVAGLLHDVGMLFVNPVWMHATYQLSDMERRHVAAHPITGMLVVRSAQIYPESVERAVLEHHEFMDGSGYPRGVRGESISPLGQVLMLAEVVSAFFDKYHDLPSQRLSLMLRMNHRRYPAHLVRWILPLLHDELTPGIPLLPLQEEVVHNVAALSAAFALWQTLREQLPEHWRLLPDGQPGVFVDERLAALRRQLADVGAEPGQHDDLMALLQSDLPSMTEFVLINREALWQLRSVVHACLHRWPQIGQTEHVIDRAVSAWCDACAPLQPSPEATGAV